MSSIVLRSRIISKTCRSKIINRRVYSSEAVSSPSTSSSSSNPSKETIIASQTILSNHSAPPPPPPPPAALEVAPEVSGRKSWSFLKYGLIASITGAVGYAGYLSYKCSYEEIEQKAKALRAAADYTPSEDASDVDKYRGLLYSAAMTVPAKTLEAYLDLRRLVEENVLEFTEPTSDKLLPDLHPTEQHVFTLVLDLNETLLYTDWKRERGWRTFKRPGVDAFLEHLAKFYEIVVYSDQMNMDLSKLNRDPAKILYLSAHAFDTSLQPENCVPIKPYKLESEDTALLDLIPFLEYVARNSPADIRKVLQSYERQDIAKEFLERSKDYQRRMQEQRQQGRFWRRCICNFLHVEGFLVLGTQFAGGVFLGTAMMHFLSDANETFEDLTTKQYPFAFMLACAGYVLTMVADCVVSYVYGKGKTNSSPNGDLELQGDEQTKTNPHGDHSVGHGHGTDTACAQSSSSLTSVSSFGDSVLLIMALCFHSVFEGIAIGVAETEADAWKALWTISLHKIFAAIAMGIALLRMIPDRPLFSCIAYAFAFAISSPVGVAIGIVIDATTQGTVADWVFAISMGLACGVFIYVSINHLLSKGYTPQKTVSVDTPHHKVLAVLLGVGVISVVMIWDT
ncbi:Zinc/iron permease [Corchorus olitorius]|uniref:Zinc/iron permease n=1 Tax=Corchorus olitorius TaxID=93759 RepID=A0A1R3KAW9_9ROSI|nr:Zinc/iron permease [Corchorus olitorius]